MSAEDEGVIRTDADVNGSKVKDRITVNLSAKTSNDLLYLQEALEKDKTNAVGDAVRFYAKILRRMGDEGSLYVKDSKEGRLTEVIIV